MMVQWIAAIYWFVVQYAKTTGRSYDVAAFIPIPEIKCFMDNHCNQTKVNVKDRMLNAFRPKFGYNMMVNVEDELNAGESNGIWKKEMMEGLLVADSTTGKVKDIINRKN